MIRLAVSLAVISAFVAAPALAAEMPATVSGGAQASVLVSRDGSFKPLGGRSAALREGDRIVTKTGVAKIAFSDGCKIELKAGSLFTVGKMSPCAAAHGGLVKTQAQTAGALGGALPEVVTLPVLGTVGLGTAIGVGVGTALVVGLTVAGATGSFDDTPASP